MGTDSGRHGRGRRVRAHRFVELAQPSLEPHPVHVRHQLQPVLNLEHQRRERVVQSLGLVRSFQRRRGVPAVPGLRAEDVASALSGVLKRSSRTPPTRNDMSRRFGRVRAARGDDARVRGRKVSFVSTGDHNDRNCCTLCESRDSFSSRVAVAVTRPRRARRVDGERADEPARVRRMPYVSNGALPRAARFPPPAPAPPRVPTQIPLPRPPGSATPADSTSHRCPS